MKSRNKRRAQSRMLRRTFSSILNFLQAPDGARDFLGTIAKRLTSQSASPSHIPGREDALLPQKPERITQLLGAGLNVADFESWQCNRLQFDELYAFLELHRSISIRCFKNERVSEPSPQLPVAYEVDSWDRVRRFCTMHTARYGILVNEALPLAQSLYCGNVILLDPHTYVMAFFEGKGTPRDIDTGAKKASLNVFRRSFGEPLPHDETQMFERVAESVRTFMPPFRPMTLEFSIYPGPVGILGHKIVFWEWRGGSMHDLDRVISHLLTRADAFDLSATFAAV